MGMGMRMEWRWSWGRVGGAAQRGGPDSVRDVEGVAAEV